MALQILVTDDHRLLREGLRSLLETQGFQVSGRSCGRSNCRETRKGITTRRRYYRYQHAGSEWHRRYKTNSPRLPRGQSHRSFDAF